MVGKAVKIEAAARNGCITKGTYDELVLLLRDKFTSLVEHGENPRVLTSREVESAFLWGKVLVSTFDESKLAQAVGYHTHRLGELRAVSNLPKESPNEGNISSDNLTMLHPSLGNLAQQSPVLQEVSFQQESFAFTD
jgi:hypothetical protein